MNTVKKDIGLLNKIMRVVEKITDFCVYISGMCMVFMLIFITINIFLRQIGHSVFGLGEINGYLMPWLCFLSIPAGLRAGREIEIDVLFRRLHSNVQRKLQVMTTLITIFLFVLIFIWSTNMVMSSYKISWVTVELGLPIWPWQICLPLGMLLYALEEVGFLLRIKKGESK